MKVCSLFHVRLSFQKFPVQLHILVGRPAPAEIAAQGPIDQNRPIVLISIGTESPPYGIQHIVCVIGFERKPVAKTVSAVGNGILESSCFSHDRPQGSLLEGIRKISEPA